MLTGVAVAVGGILGESTHLTNVSFLELGEAAFFPTRHVPHNMRTGVATPLRPTWCLDGGGLDRRDDAVERCSNADLIAVPGGGKDQLAVLYIDVRVVIRLNVEGLNSLENEWAHGQSAVCAWVCPRT